MTTWGDLTGHTWGELFTWGDPLGSPDTNIGVPFLTNATTGVSILFEIAFGADLSASPIDWPWTDVTADVLLVPQVFIVVGRADSTSAAQFATANFQLLNDGAPYSPYTRASVNWPNVTKGTPLRISVNPGTGFVAIYQGYIPGFPLTWDITGKRPAVTINAGGILRRYSQGTTPLRSPLTSAIIGAGPYQYWPCEDGVNATSAASAVNGGSPMTATGSVQFYQMDYGNPAPPIGLPPGIHFGTDLLPLLNTGGSLVGSFPAGQANAWTVQFATFWDPTITVPTLLAEWHTQGTTSKWRVWVESEAFTSFPQTWLEVDGVTVATVPHELINEDIRIDAHQSGSNIAVTFKPLLGQPAVTGTIAARSLGGITKIITNPNQLTVSNQFSIGHVRIWNGNSAPNFKTGDTAVSAWNGYNNELVTDRLLRIAAQLGTTATIAGTSNIRMGIQPISDPLSILGECQAADGGNLYDGFDSGYRYQCRSARYNLTAAVTLDAAAKQLGAVLAPADDDQITRNRWTITRSASIDTGSSATFEDTDGPLGSAAIGVYDDSASLNLVDDSGLLGQAAWRVNLGTVEGMRYPTLPINFAATPGQVADWLAAGDLGYRTDVINVAEVVPEHPGGDIEVVIEGIGHTIDPFTWSVTENCSSNLPLTVAVVSGSRPWVDSANSTLHAGITSSATSFLVDVALLWTTTLLRPTAFPFALKVGDEQMTCTGISGVSSPQTFTVTRIAPSYSHNADEKVSLWRPPVIAL